VNAAANIDAIHSWERRRARGDVIGSRLGNCVVVVNALIAPEEATSQMA
jgi:hypothetical protein